MLRCCPNFQSNFNFSFVLSNFMLPHFLRLWILNFLLFRINWMLPKQSFVEPSNEIENVTITFMFRMTLSLLWVASISNIQFIESFFRFTRSELTRRSSRSRGPTCWGRSTSTPSSSHPSSCPTTETCSSPVRYSFSFAFIFFGVSHLATFISFYSMKYIALLTFQLGYGARILIHDLLVASLLTKKTIEFRH